MLFSVLINPLGVTSPAATSRFAVYDDLNGKSNIGPGSVSRNVDPISNRAGGRLGPATATVCGNVLVFGPGQVVDAADVSPVPVVG